MTELESKTSIELTQNDNKKEDSKNSDSMNTDDDINTDDIPNKSDIPIETTNMSGHQLFKSLIGAAAGNFLEWFVYSIPYMVYTYIHKNIFNINHKLYTIHYTIYYTCYIHSRQIMSLYC